LSDRHIHLVRVIVRTPRDLAGLPVSQTLVDQAALDESKAQAELKALAGTLEVPADRPTTWLILRAKDVAATLVEHAVEQDALAIVMATRAATPTSRALVGSVADHVMRESLRPVILVPPGAAFLGGKQPTIARVLVPLDDSSLALRSLEFLITLPHASDLEFFLLEIVAREDERAAAEARLGTTATWLRSRGARSVEARVVVAADAAVAIVDGVRDALPDAIAMSTRGASGLGRMLLGSVAEGVVRRSELPVMLLSPRVLAQPIGRA
jgi:nucleotide-binding universal stress UspA family protein